MRMIITATLVAGVLAATASQAAGLRCGNSLISQGDGITSVIEKCGEAKREARLVNSYGKQIGTILYFDAGYGKNDRRVIFRGGRVVSIERVR